MERNSRCDNDDLGPVDYRDEFGQPKLTPGRSRMADRYFDHTMRMGAVIARWMGVRCRTADFQSFAIDGLIEFARLYDPESEFEIINMLNLKIHSRIKDGIRNENVRGYRSKSTRDRAMHRGIPIPKMVSISQPIGNSEELTIEETIIDENASIPGDDDPLRSMLDTLTKRLSRNDEQLIRLYFGHPDCTMRKIASITGLHLTYVHDRIHSLIRRLGKEFEIGDSMIDIRRKNQNEICRNGSHVA